MILDSLGGAEQGERAARRRLGEILQARWGCPRADHTPPATLPADLAAEARYYGETVGLVPLVPLGRRGAPPPPLPACLNTCPYATPPPRWVRELLRFHRLAHSYKGGVTFAETLGRTPTQWDIAGLDALVLAQGDAQASDDAIREAERKSAPEPPPER